eukprot:augustus_masked-scaffold_8-processed-gene-3.11-mRNA-1 protein AED:0.13 eAED:0.34 QI:0/0/0/1/1/1/3/0/1415
MRELTSAKMMSKLDKGTSYKIAEPLLGNGAFRATGLSWHDQSLALNKGLNEQVMRKQIPALEKTASDLVLKLQQSVSAERDVDLFEVMLQTSMDALCRIAFNFEMGCLKARNADEAPLYSDFNTILHTLQKRIRAPYLHYTRFLPTKENLLFNKAIESLNSTVLDLIAKRREENKLKLKSKEPSDLLDALLCSNLDEKLIVDNLKNVLFAGHDTTASAMTWAVYLLGKHQNVQLKLFAELKRHLGSKWRSINFAQLKNLKYLDAVILEVLRIYPSASFARKAKEDIEVAGYVIPKGTDLGFSPYVVQREDFNFSRAEEFLPERWLKTDEDVDLASRWTRYVPITSEYALYYNTTNEYNPDEGELGIDFLSLSASFSNIIAYPIAGFLIDQYGLNMITLGALGQTIGCWIFYLAFQNYPLVVAGRLITAVSGPLNYASILRLSTHWFAPKERILAISLAIFVSTIGGSLALLIPPLYKTGDEELRLDLKSCDEDFIKDVEELNLSTTQCIDDADDSFCCAAPTDIEGINLLIAVLMSGNLLYTFLVVKDSPPTPPAVSAQVKSSMGFLPSLIHCFSHINYFLITFADFLASGVVLVVFNTISRLFPSDVADIAIWVSALAMPLALPLSFVVSRILGKTGKFYDVAAVCYYLGFFTWWMAALGLALGGNFHYMLVVGASAATLLYLIWQVVVFELKLEYVFVADYALQGIVVATDRTLANLSTLIFLSNIPPEKYDGPAMSGRMFTFVVGGAVFAVAVIIVAFLPHKRRYLRAKVEAELNIKQSSPDGFSAEDGKKEVVAKSVVVDLSNDMETSSILVCINEAAKKSLLGVNEECSRMIKNFNANEKHSCRHYSKYYYNNSDANKRINSSAKMAVNQSILSFFPSECNEEYIREEITEHITDIEDLVTEGKKTGVCPYFASREKIRGAHLVMLPYNYLFSRRFRKMLGIDRYLKTSVIIIDEAHNVEEVCCQVNSWSGTLQTIQESLAVRKAAAHVGTKEHYANNRFIAEMLRKLVDWVSSIGFPTGTKQDDKLFTGEYFVKILQSIGIDHSSLSKLYKFALDVEDMNKNIIELLNALSSITKPLTKPSAEKTACKRPIKSFLNAEDFVVLVHMDKEKTLLNLVCVSARLAFTDIRVKAQTLVLASGTLAPLSSYAQSLYTRFAYTMQGSHVADIKSSLRTICLPKVTLGHNETFTFNSSSIHKVKSLLPTYVKAVARSLLMLLPEVPISSGALVFTTSYNMRDRIFLAANALLKREQSYQNLKRTAQLYKEEHVSLFKRNIKTKAHIRNMMFGVFRGKMSEGVDFIDDECRMIVLVGIPYPALFEPMTRARMWLSNRNKLSTEWYSARAWRAANQALGRTIRHKDDYGAVILLDDRYMKEAFSAGGKLSKWIRPSIKRCESLENCCFELKEFYAAH